MKPILEFALWAFTTAGTLLLNGLFIAGIAGWLEPDTISQWAGYGLIGCGIGWSIALLTLQFFFREPRTR